MVSLTMMARLLEAVRPDARLVLVGDPDQLASVEAGAVLADLARAPGAARAGASTPRRRARPAGGEWSHGVVMLDRIWRFGGAIAELAAAVRDGDADAAVALLRGGTDDAEFVETDPRRRRTAVRADVVDAGDRRWPRPRRRGDAAAALAALERHRLLCAHRSGPHGVARWSRQIERWLAEARPARPSATSGTPGRPLLVTANDYDIGPVQRRHRRRGRARPDGAARGLRPGRPLVLLAPPGSPRCRPCTR